MGKIYCGEGQEKSGWKFYVTLVMVSALLVGGGYYFSNMYNVISNNESGNDKWNNIRGGSFEELPVGYSIDVPDKVNDNLERKQGESGHLQIPVKYKKEYSFNDLFYGNLRPKDFSVLTNKIWNPRFECYKGIYTEYGTFVDIYLNFSNIIEKYPDLIDFDNFKIVINGFSYGTTTLKGQEMNNSEIVNDNLRELSKYNLANSNEFYKLIYDIIKV